MSKQVTLERSYRRILAWYPRSFRADSEDEILAVLLATADDGQTRVGLAEAWDLVRGAVRMRLWPAAPRPRSIRIAVKLMLAGAAAELAAMITVIATWGNVRTAVAARDAATLQAVHLHQVTDIALAPVAIGMWLWLAWANGRGQDWARPLSAACFGLISFSLIAALAQDAAAFAPAVMIAAAIVWALGLSSVVLILTPAAGRYYRPQPARQ
jgi:DNA-binding transcriptional regulator YdaS (Cro superfamily)